MTKSGHIRDREVMATGGGSVGGSADPVGCRAQDPDELADGVIHAIDQTWGVSVSDITAATTGEVYILSCADGPAWRRTDIFPSSI